MKKSVRYIISYVTCCRSDKVMITHIALSLLKATFIASFIPLKHYHSRFSTASSIHTAEFQPFNKDFYYFSKAFRVVPWTVTCLIRNLAYQIYFEKKKLQFPIYLGLWKNENDRLLAHAWSVIDQRNTIHYTRIWVHE